MALIESKYTLLLAHDGFFVLKAVGEGEVSKEVVFEEHSLPRVSKDGLKLQEVAFLLRRLKKQTFKKDRLSVQASQSSQDRVHSIPSPCLTSASPPTPPSYHPYEEVVTILEHQEVPNCGSFTSYSDGSVSAQFLDRALVRMEKDTFKVLTPSGHVSRVSYTNRHHSVHFHTYLQPVFEFLHWASLSVEERQAQADTQVFIQDHIKDLYLYGEKGLTY